MAVVSESLIHLERGMTMRVTRVWKVLVLFGLLGFGVFSIAKVGTMPPALVASDDPVKVGGG